MLGLVVTASIPSMIIIPLLFGLGISGVVGGIVAIVFARGAGARGGLLQHLGRRLNRTLGALTGAGLVVMGLLAFWVLYLYVLLIVRAMRGALRVGS